jgi:hypothetical protein
MGIFSLGLAAAWAILGPQNPRVNSFVPHFEIMSLV